MLLSSQTITLTFISFTQPGLHATWCNRITQELLRFERLAWFSFVAERQIAAECWYCGLGGQRSLGVKGGGIWDFLAWGQWEVWSCSGSQRLLALFFYTEYTSAAVNQKKKSHSSQSFHVLIWWDKTTVLESYLRSTGCWGLRSLHPGDGNVCKML